MNSAERRSKRASADSCFVVWLAQAVRRMSVRGRVVAVERKRIGLLRSGGSEIQVRNVVPFFASMVGRLASSVTMITNVAAYSSLFAGSVDPCEGASDHGSGAARQCLFASL